MNRRRYFYSILLILLLIVAVFGWFVTDHLGNNARQEIIRENQTSALTVSIYVSSTLNYLEGAVKSLAGSPWIAPALTSKADQNIENANSALDRYNSALNASVSYLMDADGMTVASSNRKDPDSFVGKSYRFRPYFQEAAKGKPGRYYAMGITSGKRGFYASCPVQNRLGKVLGVVTMKKDLDEMETFISKYPYCFLVSPDGIIFLSSKPAMDLKSLWPLDKTIQEELIASRQFGNKPFEAVMKKEIADGAEVTLEGDDYFVSRKVIDSDGWSIVLLSPTNHVRSYKLIGILATFSVCLLILIFSGVIYATDRSREAVRQSQESYKSLAEKSIAGVYVVQDGKFRFINANAASFAGYTREELLGRDARILISPEDREQVRQNARAMLLDEGNSPYEFRIITKQGEALWIMETVASTPEGKIILANPAMARMFGYDSPEELVAGIHDIARQHYAHPEERERIKEQIERHGSAANIETQHCRRDGSLFWVSMTMQAIRDEKGRLLYYEGIDEDITDRKESLERLRKALGGTIQAISMAVETKDPYTAGHQRRTADLARAIATEMGFDADQRDFIRIAATIHDIGKIALPAEILSKPTKLTDIEFSLIKTHALQGYEILKDIEFPWPVADVVLQHHERIDGSGYPDGLKGEDILPAARILSVADVVEAIASNRPYRAANGIDDALAEISKNRGILYDADVVDACLTLFREKMYHLS
jgi:PAS domain S-box-containing protein/putative nucleotidyltransferase with HDIG domain